MRIARLLGFRVNERAAVAKLDRLNRAIRAGSDVWAAYTALAGHTAEAAGRVVDACSDDCRPSQQDLVAAEHLTWRERIQFFDSITYLPDDLLVKVDRASMSVGLEARVPLLDHSLVEWAWSLPQSAKVRGGRGKWVLREVLARQVPRYNFDRPKQGFSIPLDGWLRGPLRTWSDDLLSVNSLEEFGILDKQRVIKLWQEHKLGAPHGQALWNVLMLQAWLRSWRHVIADTSTGLV